MPKKTVDIILKSGNNYLIEAKGNQPKLRNQIKAKTESDKPIDTYLTEEKNRGRKEYRLYEIYEKPENIHADWNSIQRIIHVHRYGQRTIYKNKKPTVKEYSEHHYYITSVLFKNASIVGKGIRGHWGIENRCHYVKDTHFKEDKNRIRCNNAAAVLSVFQDITMNLFRAKGCMSIKHASIAFANKIKELFKLINTNHISDF